MADSPVTAEDVSSDSSTVSGLLELSPRQPPTKRTSSTAAAANTPPSPAKRAKAVMSFITHMVGEEATKKPPFKVEAVRTLLGKVSELQEAVLDLVASNASLNGMLMESRSQLHGNPVCLST